MLCKTTVTHSESRSCKKYNQNLKRTTLPDLFYFECCFLVTQITVTQAIFHIVKKLIQKVSMFQRLATAAQVRLCVGGGGEDLLSNKYIGINPLSLYCRFRFCHRMVNNNKILKNNLLYTRKHNKSKF